MIRAPFLYRKTLKMCLVKAGAPLVYRSSSTDQAVLIICTDQAVSIKQFSQHR